MTGFWTGRYWYDAPSEPVVSFLANIDDAGGALSGSISEPNTISRSSQRLESFIRGTRDGFSVAFAKVYDGSADLAHRVDYAGELAHDGLSVSGRWILEGWTGGFEMARQSVAEIEDEAKAEQAAAITMQP
ncbi:hypothetical protein [Sphingomonas colocasiae]|uniref:Uncharacterized protein n=1 Tax=Sphingomonas colocasiae TaxID=1848973 RepID=A0ABS7PRA2_9SPHN|nr:hypothetical protein [Sphingomonas colocasiae]MBY8823758.1 hypothetical protein [Sphingomonas colocasiae]